MSEFALRLVLLLFLSSVVLGLYIWTAMRMYTFLRSNLLDLLSQLPKGCFINDQVLARRSELCMHPKWRFREWVISSILDDLVSEGHVHRDIALLPTGFSKLSRMTFCLNRQTQ